MFEQFLGVAERFRKLNRILDVGPGEGYFGNLCHSRGWEVWGIDPVADYAKGNGLASRLHTVQGHFMEVYFEEANFDVVTFINVLEHLDDPFGALKKTLGILRKGGAVIIRTPDAFVHMTLKRVVHKLGKLWKPLENLDFFAVHQYAFSRRTMKKYLVDSGFNGVVRLNHSLSSSLPVVANAK